MNTFIVRAAPGLEAFWGCSQHNRLFANAGPDVRARLPVVSGGYPRRRRMARGRLHIKAVADLLGHSSISITGDIHGHTSDATTRAAEE